MHNPSILKAMCKIYGCIDTDWMGYKATSRNIFTYHHINEKRTLPKSIKEIETIENGAILTKKAHQMLHKIELIDDELYEEYRFLFKIINERREPISSNLWDYIYTLKKRAQLAVTGLNKQEVFSCQASGKMLV